MLLSPFHTGGSGAAEGLRDLARGAYPSSLEAESRETYIGGQPGLHSKTLSQAVKKEEKERREGGGGGALILHSSRVSTWAFDYSPRYFGSGSCLMCVNGCSTDELPAGDGDPVGLHGLSIPELWQCPGRQCEPPGLLLGPSGAG